MTVGAEIWISIPNDSARLYPGLRNTLLEAAIMLSFATNAITTMLMAYKLWYVAVDRIDRIQWLIMK